jgi:AcrR family transcriptional regulator
MSTPETRRYAPRMAPGQRREQLLDAALDLALERGFHAVTIDGVARAAGVTRPVVYGLFPDVSALLSALVQREQERALAGLLGALPSVPEGGVPVDPEELVVAGLTAFLTSVHDNPRTWRVMLLPPEGAPRELQDRLVAERDAALAQIRELTVWGMPRLRGGATLDPELFARALQGLAEGAARLLLADPEAYPVERFTGFARTLLGTLTARV